ncbi:phosphoribosylaminoimidazole carboxylase, chloroplastic isoform X2, partial [Tanacetum coccineum]
MMQVIIAGAGGAAHFPGMVAALTPLPVIDILYVLLDGLDSLLSIVQMPRGVPVATVAINNATNAGLLTVRMLGVADTSLQARMLLFKKDKRHLWKEQYTMIVQFALTNMLRPVMCGSSPLPVE